MMKKGKITVVMIIAIVLVVMVYAYTLTKRNYDYGDKLRSEASQISIQFYLLADAITHLEYTVTEGRETFGGDRLAFDSAMSAMRTHFGSDDAPFTEEIRSDWIDEIESWYKQTKDDSGIIAIFTDEVLRSEFSAFEESLYITAAKLDYIFQRYQHMTNFERYLSNWRLEQRLLSESVALNRAY